MLEILKFYSRLVGMTTKTISHYCPFNQGSSRSAAALKPFLKVIVKLTSACCSLVSFHLLICLTNRELGVKGAEERLEMVW
jgi:hypothetical protein